MKLVDGENKVRLVSEFEQFISVFKDQPPKTRFVAYVIDRVDGKVKPFTFGAQIAGGIQALATSSEYAFGNLPPYDIIITKSGSGMDTEYKVNAARKDTPLTEEEKEMVAKENPIAELARKLDKSVSAPIDVDSEDIDVKDIPF